MLDVIRSGEVSPLELMLGSQFTPKKVIDVAKDCCLPNPNLRPDFATIAERFSNMLKDEDNDPRPLVRIKNKKVAKLSIPRLALARRRPVEPVPGFMHSTYRDKFRRKSGSTRPKAPRTARRRAALRRRQRSFTTP